VKRGLNAFVLQRSFHVSLALAMDMVRLLSSESAGFRSLENGVAKMSAIAASDTKN
jgi:hypothetical protein